VSKNVAVFVDVANIFYAAKAAGVDIDYVTLLKSATAGRDFVRAYAYTGLDPENDNQRNFHDFLKRSGYKVVSKDIRKYGDGRIKANLDIELVVDLMRLAQHIDIAVVVSGDGDFAPAIKAVQQMGVRVEVISFSGNTSSDLKEVCDDFYEITQIARVEKGVRSGRRVAADDDLSMTAVPEKETDNGIRRRRGGAGRDRREEGRGRDRRDDREPRETRAPAVAAVADGGVPSNVIVLPGERLSRVAPGGAPEDLEPEEEFLEGVEPQAGEAGEAGEDGEQPDADGRRRRRRRGGRGRGRGRRAEGEVGTDAPEGAEGGPVDAEDAEDAGDGAVAAIAQGVVVVEEDEYLEEELPTQPQHSTFGSVWDTQIGQPSKPAVTPVVGSVDDDDYEDEPEVPEYLLAERRQAARGGNRGGQRGGQRAGRPGPGRQGGYQSAIDRERYGRSGTSMYSAGAGGNRLPQPAPQRGGGGGGTGGDRNRSGGQSGGQPQPPRRPQGQQPQQAPAPRQRDRDRDVAPVSSSAEPWSEVPADVQELLRAEMARRQGGNKPQAAPSGGAEQQSAPRSGGRRPTRAASIAEEAAVPAEVVAPAETPVAAEAPKPARKRTTKATPVAAEAPPEVVAPAETPVAEEAPKPARKRTTKATPVAAAAPPEVVAPAETPAAAEAPKPARKRTTKAAAAEVVAPAEAPIAEDAPKPTRRRSTKASSTEASEG